MFKFMLKTDLTNPENEICCDMKFEIFKNEKGENIIVKGLGPFIYQEGLPLSIIMNEFRMKGINVKVSFLHLAGELIHNGWSGDKAAARIEAGDRTPFAQAIPEVYRNDNVVAAYRAYYIGEKKHLHQWTRRNKPEWI